MPFLIAFISVFFVSCGSWHQELDDLDTIPIIEQSEVRCPYIATIYGYGTDQPTATRAAKLNNRLYLMNNRSKIQLTLRSAEDLLDVASPEHFRVNLNLYQCP